MNGRKMYWSKPAGMGSGGTRCTGGVPAISAPAQGWWQRDFLRIQFDSQVFGLKSKSALEPLRSTGQGEQQEENFLVKIVPSAPELVWMES